MRTTQERGVVLLITLVMMLVLSGLALASAIFSQHSVLTGQSQLLDKQAFFIAEAGWQRARQALAAGTWQAAVSPGNAYTESFGAGTYTVTIVDQSAPATQNGSTTYTLTSDAYVPNSTTPAARRTVVEDNTDATATNTNQSLTAAATASTEASGQAATKANDGSVSASSYWQANTAGSGQWLKLDYTASPPTLDTFILYEKSNITGITVEYSNDNSSWSSPSGVSVTNSGTTWTATFTAAAHRYFRATFTASGAGKKVSVKEWESYSGAARTATLSQGTFTTSW